MMSCKGGVRTKRRQEKLGGRRRTRMVRTRRTQPRSWTRRMIGPHARDVTSASVPSGEGDTSEGGYGALAWAPSGEGDMCEGG